MGYHTNITPLQGTLQTPLDSVWCHLQVYPEELPAMAVLARPYLEVREEASLFQHNDGDMERIKVSPRDGYEKKVEELGFCFHKDYWKEEACYMFRLSEIEEIEKATKECYRMCCDAAQYIIDNDLFAEMQIPSEMKDAIIQSWESDDLSLYGRFDFALVNGVPKMLEFNADTPTSLLECSLIQWDWKNEVFPEKDQFNGIHEAMVQSFRDINGRYGFGKIHFACCRENLEDEETLQYILSTAMEAGISTSEISMEQMLLDGSSFYTPGGEKIDCFFKLYPWEWMMRESLEGCRANVLWIEPIWKSIMSNKAILVILSRLYQDSPYILKAGFSPAGLGDCYCKKPIFSREGANVKLVEYGNTIECSSGDYGAEGYIYQELVKIEDYDGKYPIIGSWVIGGEPAGMGIRETPSRITDNMSEFVPHIIL